jgi:glycerol-3-phosphate dehydrogenase (NAD(P)+)
MKINIIGAGTWGVTLAYLLSKKADVLVWSRSRKLIDSKTRTHSNLNNFKIPDSISFTTDSSDLDLNNLTIIAIPSNAFEDGFDHFLNCELENGKYLIASKGFNSNTNQCLLLSEALKIHHGICDDNIAVISGPNHAEEIIEGKASATVIASTNISYAKELQSLFSSNTFRVYTSKDVSGVQIGAAIKNIIAIASGLCVGLKLGDNTQAALVSRGMNEILSLNNIYDFDIKTVYGLSGLGDLIATCYSPHSRNRKLGILIAEGYALREANMKIGMVSEGINACKIVYDILDSNRHKIDLPICNEVYNILFKNADPSNSLNNLMTRNLKNEN